MLVGEGWCKSAFGRYVGGLDVSMAGLFAFWRFLPLDACGLAGNCGGMVLMGCLVLCCGLWPEG